MLRLGSRGYIAQVEDECDVIVRNTRALITECLRLRYQVYRTGSASNRTRKRQTDLNRAYDAAIEYGVGA